MKRICVAVALASAVLVPALLFFGWGSATSRALAASFAVVPATAKALSITVLILSLVVLLGTLWFTTWSGTATISLRQLSVTQFVACLFYGASFALVYWQKDGTLYDPGEWGFGEISAAMFTNEIRDPGFRVFLGSFVMLGFVAANAWRYFLSFWFVEESGAFRRLVRDQQALKTREGVGFVAAEWFLRFVSLMCLYLVQASFGNAGKYVEVLLAAVFGALLAWDCLILWRFDPTKDTEDQQESVRFRETVVFWRKIEGWGFVASVAYIALAWRAKGEWLSTFATVLALVFMFLAAVDINRNWEKYRALIVPVVSGTAVAVLVTRMILRWI